MRRIIGFLAGLGLLAGVSTAQDAAGPPYDTVFYKNGTLNLEAYVYTPPGKGPFPLVVYNHGSRAGQERTEWPVGYIARWLVPEGFAVIVPERRGYGQSDGEAFSEEIGPDRGERFLHRMTQEASDVNAAVVYAQARLPVDRKRIMTIGYSFGGIVTTLAASESSSYSRVVNQAPGALNWGKSEPLRDLLVAAAGKIRVPMLCMAAENDATTENVRAICGAAKAHGARTTVTIYPPFINPQAPKAAAPGHAVFARAGIDVWKDDVLKFLRAR